MPNTKNSTPSIFTKIINKEIPSNIIDETSNYITIKDIHPIAKVHVLVIPKTTYKTLEEMPETALGNLIKQTVTVAQKLHLPSYRMTINVHPPYQEIPHVHVHLTSDHPPKN